MWTHFPTQATFEWMNDDDDRQIAQRMDGRGLIWRCVKISKKIGTEKNNKRSAVRGLWCAANGWADPIMLTTISSLLNSFQS